VSLDGVRSELGDEVADMVASVTHDNTLSWIERSKAYIETVRTASEEAKAISVADKIANAESLISSHAREGSEVWRHFSTGREKKLWFEEAVLAMLQESWSHPLVEEYARFVKRLQGLE
ncbi:hypothetical protein MNBD_CPR01-305, partial [hydrothermal vent metagenome]